MEPENLYSFKISISWLFWIFFWGLFFMDIETALVLFIFSSVLIALLCLLFLSACAACICTYCLNDSEGKKVKLTCESCA